MALGAAVQAGLKAKDAALDEVVMTDIAPYSLGVEVSKRISATVSSPGHFDPIIERNSLVPVSRVKTYYPTVEGQALVNLSVYQGEARMVSDNIHLGNLTIALPPLAMSESGVDVRFTYDVNGLLQVEAAVQKNGDKFTLLIEGNPGLLSEREIAERLKALAEIKIHPRDTLDNRTLLARSERIYEQLRGEVREWLAEQILQFEAALASQDNRVIGPIRLRLEQQLNTIEKDSSLFAQAEEVPQP